MNKIKILDCTLRDGIHVNKGNFGINNMKKIIKDLVKSKIDIIEIGFLQDKGPHSSDSAFYYK